MTDPLGAMNVVPPAASAPSVGVRQTYSLPSELLQKPAGAQSTLSPTGADPTPAIGVQKTLPSGSVERPTGVSVPAPPDTVESMPPALLPIGVPKHPDKIAPTVPTSVSAAKG